MAWDRVVGSVFALVVFFGVVDIFCVLWDKNARFTVRNRNNEEDK